VSTYLLDINVMLALSLSRHQYHLAATEWFDEADFEWATTPMTEAGYIRLAINPQLTGTPISATQAIRALHELREAEGHRFVPDATTLADPVIDLGPMVGANQVTDYHLVNLAAQNSMRLATFDGSLFRSLAEVDRGHVYVIDS
jgi:toxin-antitoxin system PIN domain toxin